MERRKQQAEGKYAITTPRKNTKDTIFSEILPERKTLNMSIFLC